VIWAGEAAGADVVRSALSGHCEVRAVDPVVPRADLEHPGPTRQALLALWRERVESLVPGADAVARWTDDHVLPRRRAEDLALGYLAAARGQPAWLARTAADGAWLSCAASADPRNVVTARGACDANAARLIRPWAMGSDPTALRAESTDALRAAAAAMPASTRPATTRAAGLLIATGDLTQLGAEDALRALVDGLEPIGALQLALDELEGFAALGGLAEVAPELAGPVLAHDLTRSLGGLVAPGWGVRAGGAAFRFRTEAGENGRGLEAVEIAAE
jgi:hypothetical protein